MYLDSDSVPLAFPDDLFGSPHYVLPGNLFFPEVWKEGVREVSVPFVQLRPAVHVITSCTGDEGAFKETWSTLSTS